MSAPLFDLGRIVSTPAALQAMAESHTDGQALLARHITGDWGDLDDEDKQMNDESVGTFERILSAYTLSGTHARVWIITEADRSATTFLLPEEY